MSYGTDTTSAQREPNKTKKGLKDKRKKDIEAIKEQYIKEDASRFLIIYWSFINSDRFYATDLTAATVKGIICAKMLRT